MIKCNCCGKRKRFLESFEEITIGTDVLYICKKCSTIIYKIRDAVKYDQDNKDTLIAVLEERMCKDSFEFKKWFQNRILKK